MSKVKKKKTPKEILKFLLTKKNIVTAVICGLFIVMYIQIQSIFGTFSFLQGRDSSLIAEIGQIKESYLQLGENLNEVRRFLRMPTENYVGFEEPGEPSEGQNKNTIQLALFKYVDFLASNKNFEEKFAENKNLLENLAKSETFLAFLVEQGLNASSVTENEVSFSLKIDDTFENNLLLFYLEKETGSLFIKTIKTKEEVSYDNFEEFQDKTVEFLKDEKEDLIKAVGIIKNLQAEIAAAINSTKTQETLLVSGLTLTPDFVEKNLKITYSIQNKAGDLIGEIILDSKTASISLVDKSEESLSVQITDFSASLVPFLTKLDARTFIEKKTAQALSDLQKTVDDEGFKLLLSENGLAVSPTPREDDERIYYDILDSEGIHVSSLVVEKMTGVVNIVEPNGTNSENLLFFDPDFKKKTLEIPDQIPEFDDTLSFSKNSFDVLIAGKHGNLIDTMIFAHINEDTRKVRMISIPRDLFYNGRKINSFAYYYGMPELVQVLSDITGYQLDKYILVDMYAFIDVVDLIGGIDIHLDNPVIDPTYRTVDNGVVGTLYYEPGDYHLGGVESLRLARTRHTSSDFARAERQQMILASMQDKAGNFSLGDANTIYEIAKTILAKTETDINLDEAIAYYFRYQNYEIESNNVMSSGNVLYVPPYITTENCNKLIEAANAAGKPKPGCENQNNAYTLLPRDNNWNIVKWFFRENFEGI